MSMTVIRIAVEIASNSVRIAGGERIQALSLPFLSGYLERPFLEYFSLYSEFSSHRLIRVMAHHQERCPFTEHQGVIVSIPVLCRACYFGQDCS